MGLADLSTTPKNTDTIRILEVRILNALRAGGSGTGGAGLTGSGSPEGSVSATPGTTYYDTTGGTFWVKESGSGNTNWAELIA
jgi:hypothetical protein